MTAICSVVLLQMDLGFHLLPVRGQSNFPTDPSPKLKQIHFFSYVYLCVSQESTVATRDQSLKETHILL